MIYIENISQKEMDRIDTIIATIHDKVDPKILDYLKKRKVNNNNYFMYFIILNRILDLTFLKKVKQKLRLGR